MSNPHRLALDPPQGPLFVLERKLLESSSQYARESPRKRVIVPFHRSLEDPLHRMLNAVQPETYVRPHRHREPAKAEAWVVLRGSLLFFTFEETGAVAESLVIGSEAPAFGVDLVPGIYHSFLALAPDTVIYEVKTGPYQAGSDKDFASWAPAEGSPEAAQYMADLREIAVRRGVL
jgi:cupin fold WbuC family metalloprotein